MKKRNKDNLSKFLISKFISYGLHLGGLKALWNPQMVPYIVAFRNSFCILNLSLTHRCMRQAFRYLSKLLLSHKKILFVGGPKGLEKSISVLCQEKGHFHISNYTDGLFSNFQLNKDLSKLSFKDSPSLIFFFDLSIKEKAKKDLFDLNIPIMAFVSSRDNISGIDYPIPANVNSLKGGIFVFNLFSHFFSVQQKIK